MIMSKITMEIPALVASVKPSSLQLIQGLDRTRLTDQLVALENDVGELFLAGDLVEEAHALRPDLV